MPPYDYSYNHIGHLSIMNSSIPTEKHKSRLLALKAELEELLAAHTEDSAPVELDQTRMGRLSRMDAMQVQAMAQATSERRKRDLQRINSALARIETDDYGYCMQCDEPIADKRLELDPATLTCIACASGKF